MNEETRPTGGLSRQKKEKKKEGYKIKWFCHTFLCTLFVTDCILIVRHPDDGHRSDRNMLVKNKFMSLKVLIYGHLFVHHKNIKHSVQLVRDDL